MNWEACTPELFFLLAAALLFLAAMLKGPRPRRLHRFVLLIAALGVLVTVAAVRREGLLFAGVYRVDLFSQVFKALFACGFFLTVCACSDLNTIRETRHAEFYFLLVTSTLGMMILVSSVHLLVLYLALELTSYPLYVLVPLRKGEGVHVEAGIKYFLVGISCSALMLFGLALLFGAVGTTSLLEMGRLGPLLIATPIGFIGLMFTLSGFFFKLALFPFHVWAPGVYQGAANQVTTYIATTTKVAAIAILVRMVALIGGPDIHLGLVLQGMALASMTLGNLAAIIQKDMKRLLAYSAVAQGGYVLVGILSGNLSGYAGAIFYAAAYLVTSFTCFLVVVKVASDGSNLQIAQLAGLHRRSPLLATALMLGVFSLGGIPPTIGFTGKFFLFTAAMKSGHFFLVLTAMANVAVSLYYYALIVKAAYVLEPDENLPPIFLSVPAKLLTTTLILLILMGGLFPQYLYEAARAAARVLL
jgi:NADH-quinone oxidoreductase subunit N